MEICKEEATGSGDQQFSFEIGRASSGQSVSDTVSGKTPQNAANALNVVANSLQNNAKRSKANALKVVANSPQIAKKTTQNAASQDSNNQKSNHENGNEKVAWKYARKRPVGVEINSSVLKSDVLVLVNLSQHCLSQNTAKRSKCA